MDAKWQLDPARFFDPDPTQRRAARELCDLVAGLPIVSPHGHAAPWLFADEDACHGQKPSSVGKMHNRA
jgi:glucuronate isomerase